MYCGEGLSPTCEAALNHCVVGVFDLGGGDFLCFLGVVGFDLLDDALAIKSDYFHCIVFEGAAGVERVVEDATNVCHDSEVFEGF